MSTSIAKYLSYLSFNLKATCVSSLQQQMLQKRRFLSFLTELISFTKTNFSDSLTTALPLSHWLDIESVIICPEALRKYILNQVLRGISLYMGVSSSMVVSCLLCFSPVALQ